MSLDLGELSGRITYDVSPAQQAIRALRADIDQFSRTGFDPMSAAARQAVNDTSAQMGRLAPEARQVVNDTGRELDRLEGEARGAGSRAGEAVVGGLKKGAAGVALVGAAVGTGFVAALSEAMEQDARTDRLGASLGIDERHAARLGTAAGNVYRENFGESLDDAAGAVRAVASTVDGIGRGPRLETLSEWAITFSDLMDADVSQSVLAAQQLVTEGLVPSVGRGFDAMMTGAQKLPDFLKGDLLDIVSEYAPYIAGLGYSLDDMFAILSKGAEQGSVGFDKAGDFLKEGSLLLTDVSATGEAYKRVGLNGKDMASRIVQGGTDARKALSEVAGAVLDIEDPVKRVNTAIELFGTPLEDLGKSESNINSVMTMLRDGGTVLGDYEGAMDRATETMGGNASSRIESFKRNLQLNVVEFIDGEVLPVLEDWTDNLDEDLAPAVEGFADVWDRVGPVVGDIVGWIVDDVLPELIDAWGRVSQAWAGFWGDVSDEWNEHPEIAEGAAMLVDGFQWLVEHVFPAMATAVENTLPVVADGIGVALDAVEKLAIGFTYVGEYGAKGASLLLDAFGWAFEGILDFADSSLGWVFDLLGMDNPIAEARDNFHAFREEATDELDLIALGARGLREQLQKEITPNVNIEPAMAAINHLNTSMPGGEIIDGRPQPGGTVQTNPAWLDSQDDDETPGKGKNKKGGTDDDGEGKGNTYVNATVQPHDYNAFKQQLLDDERRSRGLAAAGGPRQRHWMGD